MRVKERIVDGDDLDEIRLLERCACDETADATESVDADLHRSHGERREERKRQFFSAHTKSGGKQPTEHNGRERRCSCAAGVLCGAAVCGDEDSAERRPGPQDRRSRCAPLLCWLQKWSLRILHRCFLCALVRCAASAAALLSSPPSLRRFVAARTVGEECHAPGGAGAETQGRLRHTAPLRGSSSGERAVRC